jgi:cytochrome c oxidase accessory protein FixG
MSTAAASGEQHKPADEPRGPGPQPSEPQETRLYERRKKIHTLWVNGKFQYLRRVTLLVLVLVFYVSPWLTWSGHPAVWFNLPERKFVLLGATFWPQEFIFLSWLLIIAAFSLFFFTVLAGRLWCGYACPQTVWTYCYAWIEHLVEGDRNQRLKLEKSPWNYNKIRRRGLKWLLWGLFAFSISITFVGYFTPIRELLPRIIAFDLGPWERFWLLFAAGMSYLLSAALREQVCFHMCPYARFQSVMFDRDTMIISYDAERGEPRGTRSRNTGEEGASAGLGSCINCNLCVHVCPMGIDIRNGLQYQCIGCAACVDVCDSVMDRMGYAPKLVRYSSEHHDQSEHKSRMRPRLFGYGAILIAMIIAFSWGLGTRVPLELDIIRDRNRLYRENWDGAVENVYSLKIMNREQRVRSYRISALGAIPFEYTGKELVTVPAGTLVSLPIRLLAGPEAEYESNIPVTFTIETTDEPRFAVSHESRFLSPAKAASGGGER